MTLWGFGGLDLGDLAPQSSDGYFRPRFVGFFVSTSCSMFRGELDPELSEDEAKSGISIAGVFSPEGKLLKAVGLIVILLQAVDMIQGLMNEF
jgi:hypothetical protein